MKWLLVVLLVIVVGGLVFGGMSFLNGLDRLVEKKCQIPGGKCGLEVEDKWESVENGFIFYKYYIRSNFWSENKDKAIGLMTVDSSGRNLVFTAEPFGDFFRVYPTKSGTYKADTRQETKFYTEDLVTRLKSSNNLTVVLYDYEIKDRDKFLKYIQGNGVKKIDDCIGANSSFVKGILKQNIGDKMIYGFLYKVKKCQIKVNEIISD